MRLPINGKKPLNENDVKGQTWRGLWSDHLLHARQNLHDKSHCRNQHSWPYQTRDVNWKQKNGVTWDDFRYVKLPIFCFKYGITGNNEDHCKNPISLNHSIYGVNPLGSWMRSNQLGRKQIQQKERLFNSNPTKKPNINR